MLVNKTCYYPDGGGSDAACHDWDPTGRAEWSNRMWYRRSDGENMILNQGGNLFDADN